MRYLLLLAAFVLTGCAGNLQLAPETPTIKPAYQADKRVVVHFSAKSGSMTGVDETGTYLRVTDLSLRIDEAVEGTIENAVQELATNIMVRRGLHDPLSSVRSTADAVMMVDRSSMSASLEHQGGLLPMYNGFATIDLRLRVARKWDNWRVDTFQLRGFGSFIHDQAFLRQSVVARQASQAALQELANDIVKRVAF